MAQEKRHMVEISEALHKVISAKHEATGNNYIMSDLYVVETMPVSTAPTGHPNVTPLPLAESLPQYSDDNVIRVTNHEVVFEKVAK